MTVPEYAYTAAACRICSIDRQKLTDAISSGDYDFAPPTSSGRARKFYHPDLIALWTYARYTDAADWPSRMAAKLASHVKQFLDQEPEAEFVRIIYTVMGSPFVTADPIIDPKITHISGIKIRHHLVLDLRNPRASIEAGLIEESKGVGNPDE